MAGYRKKEEPHGLKQLRTIWQVGDELPNGQGDSLRGKPPSDIYQTATPQGVPKRRRSRSR